MTNYVGFFLALCSMAGIRAASFNLTIIPDHVRATEKPHSVTFTCSADVALAGCQFRWWDWYKKAGPLLELSRGPQSQADPAHLNASLTGYSYSGRGLGAGDCGVTLQVKGFKRWMVACRVQVEGGGWKYAWTDLYASNYGDTLRHSLTRGEEVVPPGGEARFMLKAEEPLAYCRFYLSGMSYWLHFSKGAESADSTGRHLYFGAGLQSGECGLALANVSEADNGPALGCIGGSSNDRSESRFLALVVERPLTTPALGLVYKGNNVTATCEVQESSPVANMSWMLGDTVIRKDNIDDTKATAQDEWRWPWMTGYIKQTLKLQLQPQDNGKDLKCVVSQVTIAQSLVVTGSILFTERTPSRNLMTITTTAPVVTQSGTINTTPSSMVSTTRNITPYINIQTSPMSTSSTPANITLKTNISTSTNPTRGPNCPATTIMDRLCHNYRVDLGSTSCSTDDVHEFRVREAQARTAELTEETAKAERAAKATVAELEIQTARSNAIAAELAVDAARSRARAEETWAQNAEEELQFERERRTKAKLK